MDQTRSKRSKHLAGGSRDLPRLSPIIPNYSRGEAQQRLSNGPASNEDGKATPCVRNRIPWVVVSASVCNKSATVVTSSIEQPARQRTPLLVLSHTYSTISRTWSHRARPLRSLTLPRIILEALQKENRRSNCLMPLAPAEMPVRSFQRAVLERVGTGWEYDSGLEVSGSWFGLPRS